MFYKQIMALSGTKLTYIDQDNFRSRTHYLWR